MLPPNSTEVLVVKQHRSERTAEEGDVLQHEVLLDVYLWASSDKRDSPTGAVEVPSRAACRKRECNGLTSQSEVLP